MLERLPGLAGREVNFGSYLLTAARHASYDAIERRRRTAPAGEIPDSAVPVAAGAGPEAPEPLALRAAHREDIRAANAHAARAPARGARAARGRGALLRPGRRGHGHEPQLGRAADLARAAEPARRAAPRRARLDPGRVAGLRVGAAAARAGAGRRARRRHARRLARRATWPAARPAACASRRCRRPGHAYRLWLPLVPGLWLRTQDRQGGGAARASARTARSCAGRRLGAVAGAGHARVLVARGRPRRTSVARARARVHARAGARAEARVRDACAATSRSPTGPRRAPAAGTASPPGPCPSSSPPRRDPRRRARGDAGAGSRLTVRRHAAPRKRVAHAPAADPPPAEPVHDRSAAGGRRRPAARTRPSRPVPLRRDRRAGCPGCPQPPPTAAVVQPSARSSGRSRRRPSPELRWPPVFRAWARTLPERLGGRLVLAALVVVLVVALVLRIWAATHGYEFRHGSDADQYERLAAAALRGRRLRDPRARRTRTTSRPACRCSRPASTG